ncbi:MAG: response regulator transcription factor [Sphingobacteriales bacterium]|nr:MAG: response regulator transcription factor [Sphingobacteriales bacterium]
MLRFLIADDHAIVRKGLTQILLKEFPSAEIFEEVDGEGAVNFIIKQDVDVVICDLDMPGRGGLEALPQIKDIKPYIPVLVLSFHSEDQYAVRILKAGASGYLKKDMAPEELINAIRRVLLGKKYISPSVAEQLADGFDFNGNKQPHELLSNREFEVFRLLANGKSVTEISKMYSLSSTTVSTYKARILFKMNMNNSADLVMYALQNNLM